MTPAVREKHAALEGERHRAIADAVKQIDEMEPGFMAAYLKDLQTRVRALRRGARE